MRQIKVKGRTKISKVAGAIAFWVRDSCRVEVIAIGESAIANAVRAVGVARWYLRNELDLVFVPVFRTVRGSLGDRRALVLVVLCGHETGVEEGEMDDAQPETA